MSKVITVYILSALFFVGISSTEGFSTPPKKKTSLEKKIKKQNKKKNKKGDQGCPRIDC